MKARSAREIWEAALGELQPKVTPANYQTWLKNTVGLALLAALATDRTQSLVTEAAIAQGGTPTDAAVNAAIVEGWSLGLIVAAGLLVLASIAMNSFIRGGKGEAPSMAMGG